MKLLILKCAAKQCGKAVCQYLQYLNIRWNGASKQKISKSEVSDFDIPSSPVHTGMLESYYFKMIGEKRLNI